MIGSNLSSIRRARKISQEELAVRLNVVRQTISKWEKGYSVPDADMIVKIADALDVSVTDLLGADTITADTDAAGIADQLSRINEQLAINSRRSRRVLQAVVYTICAALLIVISLSVSHRISAGKNNTGISAPDEPADHMSADNDQGGHTDLGEKDFSNAVPVDVNDNIIQNCADYAEALGCKTGQMKKAVLLGDFWIDYVFCGDEVKKEMIDKKDYVVIFEGIRCVVDADTEIVLGRIPYV